LVDTLSLSCVHANNKLPIPHTGLQSAYIIRSLFNFYVLKQFPRSIPPVPLSIYLLHSFLPNSLTDKTTCSVGGIRTSNLRKVSYSQYTRGSTSPVPQSPFTVRSPARASSKISLLLPAQTQAQDFRDGTFRFLWNAINFCWNFVHTLANNWQ
jgi:hypothetical protein